MCQEYYLRKFASLLPREPDIEREVVRLRPARYVKRIESVGVGCHNLEAEKLESGCDGNT